MPIPLITAIIGAAIALIKGGYDIYDAKKRIKVARTKYQSRRQKYEIAAREYQSQQQQSREAFDELGRIRLQSLVTLGKAVDFLKKAKIKERDLTELFEITPIQLKAWKEASVSAIEVIGGLASAGITGVSTAAAAYELISLFGTASTGTAISTLSGAAASNATLAWLGGGSLAAGGGGIAVGTFVIGGFVVGPAALVVGFFAQGKAEAIETQVTENVAQMEIAEAEMSQQLAILKIILRRVEELRLSTIELRNRLETLLVDLSVVPSNFLTRYKRIIWRFLLKFFTSRDLDMEETYSVARIAISLGELLDVAILDNQGSFIHKEKT